MSVPHSIPIGRPPHHTLCQYQTPPSIRYASTGHRIAYAMSAPDAAPIRDASTGHRVAYAMPVPDIA
eukprot:3439565-Rhodomonas_salina.8